MTTLSSPTTKVINLVQLGTEMGAAGGLIASVTGGDPTLGLLDPAATKVVGDPSGTFSAAQLDAAVAAHVAVNTATNAGTLRSRAQAALATNAAFLALASPSNVQTVNQVQALTKECNGIIRLLLGLLDSTSGT